MIPVPLTLKWQCLINDNHMLYSSNKLTELQVKRPVVICAALVSSSNLVVALHSYYTGVIGGQSKRAVKSFGEVASAIFQGSPSEFPSRSGCVKARQRG